MTYTDHRAAPGIFDRFDPQVYPGLFAEVLPKRIIAFAIDVVIIMVAMIPAALAVAVLGILTLGFGWLLFPFLFAVVALGYLALTLGANSATVGMRTMQIELRTVGGQRMYPLLAVLHGLLFWFSVSILTPLILLVGLFGARRRLLHDMLLGVVMVNAGEMARLERTGLV